MEGMIYAGLKKKEQKIFEKLCEENLKRSWFICYQITQDTCTAVPLLLAAWQESITQVMDTSTIPEETFHEILFSNIFTLSLGVIKHSFHKVSEHCVAWYIVSAQGFYSLASTAIFRDWIYHIITYLIHRLS